MGRKNTFKHSQSISNILSKNKKEKPSNTIPPEKHTNHNIMYLHSYIIEIDGRLMRLARSQLLLLVRTNFYTDDKRVDPDRMSRSSLSECYTVNAKCTSTHRTLLNGYTYTNDFTFIVYSYPIIYRSQEILSRQPA